MNRRSYDDLDRAVLLARRAVTAGHLGRPEPLTRFLYQRWFLGRAESAGRVPAPRDAVTRPAPRSPGPWRTWNRAWEQRDCRGSDLVRVYLSCAPNTSLHVVGAVGARAQEWDHPWLLSSRAMSQPVPAPDATVLYVPAAALEELREPLLEMVADLQPFLAGTVPAMTLPIGDGVALAQNPGDGRPYGEHRCALVAGTVIAHQRRSHRDTVDRAMTAFRRAGIDPHAPYRALGAAWTWEPQRAVSRRAA